MGAIIFRPGRLWKRFSFIRLPLLIGICGALSGCGAHFNSIYRSNEIGQQDMLITTDAQQRVLLRGHRVGSQGDVVTCVEPHPDAFTVNAASAAGHATTPSGLGAGFSGASSQSGAFLPFHTQTTTTLREQGYRLCEAYINGALSKLDYVQLLRRNQVMVTAVLAIEQLTGAVVGSGAAIGASSSVEVDQTAVTKANAEKATKEGNVEKQKTELDNAKNAEDKGNRDIKDQVDKIDQLKKAVTADPTKQTDLTNAETQLTKLNTQQTGLKDARVAAEGQFAAAKSELLGAIQNLNLALNPNLKTSTSSNLSGGGVSSTDIAGVASTVQKIVEMAFSKQYILDLCMMYWTKDLPTANDRVGAQSYQELDKNCDELFDVWKTRTEASDSETPYFLPGS